MKKILLIIFLFLNVVINSYAQEVSLDAFSKNGNIFLIYDKRNIKQLTYTGKDYTPTLSPDGQKVAFVRKTKLDDEDYTFDCSTYNEIWLYEIQANSGEAIVKSQKGEETKEGMKSNLECLGNLQFSPEGKYLYFMSSAWTTSNSIHRYDLTNKTELFITDGNSLKVIQNGKYKGFLIAEKHKYFDEGGSYDLYWLLTMDGDEIRDIGESELSIEQFLRDYNANQKDD